MNDLLNNPAIDHARKALTPEQEEEYKRIGQYMYSDEKVQLIQETTKPVETKDILMYAIQSLKSGLSAMELSKEEINALYETYGHEWYKRFDLKKDEVPVQTASIELRKQKKKGKTASQRWQARRNLLKK